MSAPTITFRSKVKPVYNMDDTLAYQYIKVPKITRLHCDMQSFLNDRRLSPYTNSNLFEGIVRRELSDRKIGSELRLDALPAGVMVDQSGFLAVVTICL